MKKIDEPIMIPPTIEGIGFGILEMIRRDAEKYNVTFESVHKTMKIDGYSGTVSWDLPIN